jgi:hypothetical protein
MVDTIVNRDRLTIALKKVEQICYAVLPKGEARPIDRKYQKRVRKRMQRAGLIYETIRGHGYRVAISGDTERCIDISFPHTGEDGQRKISIVVAIADLDAEITPRKPTRRSSSRMHEPEVGIPYEIMDMTDLEYGLDMGKLLDKEKDIPEAKTGAHTWMLWSIPVIRGLNHVPESAVELVLKRAEKLDVEYTHHCLVYGGPRTIVMLGLGPVAYGGGGGGEELSEVAKDGEEEYDEEE